MQFVFLFADGIIRVSKLPDEYMAIYVVRRPVEKEIIPYEVNKLSPAPCLVVHIF